MFVTQISGISKSRYRIYLDGQFAFVLYKGELRQFQIKENQELSEEIYQHIMTQILPKRAKLRSMNLLQSKDYTRKQLEDKLVLGEYPAECISEAIAYVESYGYIDDRRYARDFIEYNLQNKSKKRIETDLIRKGIAKDVIQEAFEELEVLGVEQDELAMACELLNKKKYCADTATKQEQQKMYGFLFRKGFCSDIISKALLLDITSNSV
ncbi:MAG: recombination regulator RecX [Lachnospiraceae bacterium]|nr:recombination regulator RecX [Lachnospiraceae bacterium]